MNIIERFAKPSKLFAAISLVIFTALIGYVDYITGPEYPFSLIYLLPIALITWSIGKSAGILLSLASVIVAFIANDIMWNPTYSSSVVPYYNSLANLFS